MIELPFLLEMIVYFLRTLLYLNITKLINLGALSLLLSSYLKLVFFAMLLFSLLV